MSSRLEQFIRDHRGEFDTDVPGINLWDKIDQQLDAGSNTIEEKKETPPQGPRVVKFNVLRWSAAAAIVILAGLGAWFYLGNKSGTTGTTQTVAAK
jgi:hypothetical protein